MIFYSNIFSLYKSWIYCRLVIDLIFVDFCISGVDAETAYTRNDFKLLKGDPGLRKQVKLTKNMLGYCTPIVLESNGMSIKSIIIYINLIVQLLQTCCVYNVLFFIHLASLTEIWFEIMFSPPQVRCLRRKKWKLKIWTWWKNFCKFSPNESLRRRRHRNAKRVNVTLTITVSATWTVILVHIQRPLISNT